jgi:hypothetical protein
LSRQSPIIVFIDYAHSAMISVLRSNTIGALKMNTQPIYSFTILQLIGDWQT